MTGHSQPDDIEVRVQSTEMRKVSVHIATSSDQLPGFLSPFIPLSSFLHLLDYTTST
jgi:hypothetical protein